MIVNKIIVLTLVVLFGCGKMQEVKLKSQSQNSLGAEGDTRLVEVSEGTFYKGNSKSESYLEFAQIQYRIGTISESAQLTFDALPSSQPVIVYFKGQYVKGILSGGTEVEVVNLEILKKKE